MTTPVVTNVQNDRPLVTSLSGTQWQVTAMWLGAMRRVYIGTLYECLQYAKEMS